MHCLDVYICEQDEANHKSKDQIMKLFCTLFTLCFQLYFVCSQNLSYTRSIVDTLCHPNMHGRGYVNEGEEKAALYIAGQMQKSGLKPLCENYFQNFEVSVNTFPDKMQLKLDSFTLKPGKDFIIDPSSPGLKGSFAAYRLNAFDLLNDNAFNALKEVDNKSVIIDHLNKEINKEQQIILKKRIKEIQNGDSIQMPLVIVIEDKKLTWRGARKIASRPVIYLDDSVDFEFDSVHVAIDNQYHSSYTTQNVVGFLPGKKDSTILISAHYDHLGRMGAETYIPGANDNASGTALLLDLARHYALKYERPPYNLLFIAFGAEEIGLLGSQYYVKHPLRPLAEIKFQLNLDLCGSGDKGIQVVNGSVFEKQFELLKGLNTSNDYLHQVKVRGESCNSDHCPFYKKDVPGFFIYTLGGSKAYHDIYDRPENLTFSGYNGFFKLLVDFIEEL